MNTGLKFALGVCSLSLLFSCAQKLPYQDTSLTAEQRAEDLLPRLTLEEKVALMQNASPAIPRLGIKEYDWWNEALHGVGRAGLATVFPQSIGMGASFNDSLLYEVFDAVSDEARVKSRIFSENGVLKRYQGLTFWTPNVNIFRDPRWGRGQETYGEDPYLTGQLGMAVVRGLQGQENGKYDKLHACAKHFAVHSGPEWNRHSFDAENIAPRDLWETYLPAFKDLVQKADVKEVMCAYNRFEGEPCCGSNRLLMQILRDEWRYKGIVVSDCGAISDFYRPGTHGTHPDKEHASAGAVLSGTDLECGGEYGSLADAVKAGLIDEKQIDVSLKRLLTARFELGEMDEQPAWAEIPASTLNSKEHQDLALHMARESLVLLQNKNDILPLNTGLKVAVMGPNANDSVMQWGNYNGIPGHTVTLLEAVRSKLPEGQVMYEPGCDRTSREALQSLFSECSINGKPGFSAEYWNNRICEGEVVATDQISTPFHFTTTGATTFAPGVEITNFSARYESVFRPSQSGDVAFRFQLDGEVTLMVDGEQVAQKVYVKNPTNLYTLQAKAGKEYHIEILFKQRNERATLDFDLGKQVEINLNLAVEKVKDADVVLFAGGISPSLEGEEMPVEVPGFKGGDRTDIELPAVQRDLLKALKKAGKKVVFINYSGSAIGLVPESNTCEAILQAWYPGQAGGTAIVDVLFGDYNPAGRLPVTFYKDAGQLPDFEDYSMKGRTYRYMQQQPLFPFGHGLSYTTFTYGEANLSKNTIGDGGTVTLTIPVSNAGQRDGDEVVQVYLRCMADKEGPHYTLRAFKRVHIPAGETKQVTIPLTYESFEWFDTATNTVHPLKGTYELLYGGSSDKNKLKTIVMNVQ
ncbi:beta-glucosidase [Bacteroides ovatus]|jgi:glycoside hydrolase family beta-glycosidase|uniref:xylan 1,4-beta-xylosidase n=1 Tax=Bacteroides TaxID=816 RepID=UPI000E9F8472|nr:MULTISPECIES: xylan 1,4-beta-xylosidase [Bacteroides]MCS3176192.1 glycoside hydrolase family 3 C-terminal domain-containing protein [Candidatus Bacteroides intestinigallinarum]RGN52831.1 glycoside hydrolase family 3 protein [Bacteroides sp. OM05-10AA]RGQ56735.1 glycoside hydrolase family 3 protein [Bacteroides sp. AF27-33]CAG9900609.1 beta-glucosidase [Bacteroides ovatus]